MFHPAGHNVDVGGVMAILWDERMPGAPNFRWREMVTGQTAEIISERRAALEADPKAQEGMIQAAEVLQAFRAELGKPIHVTSGYRGPKRTGSQHDTGHAVDIRVDGMTPLQLLARLHAWRDKSPHPFRQVGAESTHTSSTSLRLPMSDGSGLWCHIGLFSGVWAYPHDLPWFTSIAPVSGKRRYLPWKP